VKSPRGLPLGVLSQLHGWALVRADSPAEEAGFETSVPPRGRRRGV